MKCISFSLINKPATSGTAAVHCALLLMHQEAVFAEAARAGQQHSAAQAYAPGNGLHQAESDALDV